MTTTEAVETVRAALNAYSVDAPCRQGAALAADALRALDVLAQKTEDTRRKTEALREIAFYVPIVTDWEGVRVCHVDEVFTLKHIAGAAMKEKKR